MPEERLQKILSRAGVSSRRKAEQMILDGRVTVNGEQIRQLGAKADFAKDHIKVDGKLVRPASEIYYLVMNKPRGYVTTMFDPEGRPKVIDLLKGVKERVYPVGRLDFNSEGLLLLTNDGDFAQLIMTAGPEIPKTYWVKTSGKPPEEKIEKLRRGIMLDGRPTAPAQIKLLRDAPNPWYEVVLIEGRQNQIRRMFGRIGHLVEKLKRVKIGFLELGSLPTGVTRGLTAREVERFRRTKKKPDATAKIWTKSNVS
jgi:23S rRNA pseudouridine2605 synthase